MRQLILILAALCPLASAAEPFLIKDGKPRAEIVIAEKPARAAEFGAQELQKYLEKITGCRLAIVAEPTDKPLKICVGESATSREFGVTAEGLERDAFRLVSGANWLALAGNDLEFEPREPWARNHGQWAREKAAPSSMITLGFIGTGGHGIAHNLRSFLREKDCRAIAVCDVFQSRKQKAAGIINKT